MSGINPIFSKIPHSSASQPIENNDKRLPIQEKKMVLPQGESVVIQNNNSSKTQLVSTFVAANQSTQTHTAKETSRQSIQPHHEPQLQVKISSENIKIEKNNWNDPRQKEQQEKAALTARIPAGRTVQNKYETPIIDKPLRPIMVEKIDSDYNDDEDEDEESGDKRKRKSRRKLYIVLSLLSFLGAKSKRSMFVKESIRKKVSRNSSTSILKSFFDF